VLSNNSAAQRGGPAMAQATTCEHCGTVVPLDKAETLIVEDWTHHFCSELCKIQWGELAEIEEE
jgi:hypothetical protein